jgi:Divergent InlB B-repeat domain
MKTKIYSRIQILSLLTLPLALTASAFAQNVPSQKSNPGFTVNQTSLDFGTVEVGQEKRLPVEIKNTSSQPIRVIPDFTSGNDGFSLTGISSNGASSLNPGEVKTVFASCRNVSSDSTTTRPFILRDQQSKTPLITIPSVCKGVNPFVTLFVPQKITGPGLPNGPVIVQIVNDPNPQVAQGVDCSAANTGGGGNNANTPFDNCNFPRVRKGSQVKIQSNALNFTGFANGSGSAANCQGKTPCTFTIDQNSVVTATFKPFSEVADLPIRVDVRKFGKEGGDGLVSVSAENQEPLTTEGMKSGDPAKFKKFPRGTTLLIKVTPDAKSKITSIKVSGPDAKVKLCNDKPTCTFVVKDFTEVTATFEPRTRPLPFGK